MIEQVVSLRARCERCAKEYRVSRSGRAYTCKACGGKVRAEEPGARRTLELPGTVTCEECQAVNPERARACLECGAELGLEPAPSGLEDESDERLRRSYRLMDGVAWLYRLGALAYVAVTALAVLGLAREDVPLGQGVAMVALSALLAMLFVLGALRVTFEPFAWNLAAACLATVVSLGHLVGPNPFGLALPASAALALILWAALAPTLRFRRWIAAHEDRYMLHNASLHTMRSLQHHTGEDRRERLLRVKRRASRRAWGLSIAAAAAIGLSAAVGAWMIVAKVRPPELAPAVARFEHAWNAGGLAAAAESFAPAVRERELALLRGLTDGHGWGASRPWLEGGALREDEDGVWIDYPLEGLTLSAHWMVAENRWTLAELELPVPPLEPVLERFRAAWRASEPAVLAAFFSPESQIEMRASIEGAATGRGWSEFPAILGTDHGDPAGGELGVDFELERGKVETRWILRPDGTWGLHVLKLPKKR